MPWSIVERTIDGKEMFCLQNDDTGKLVEGSCHANRSETRQMQEAMYANYDGEKKSDPSILLTFGGSVKALGDGKIGGYLVTYGSEEQPDTSSYRDFFTAETDFAVDEWPARTLTFYNHGLDVKVGKQRLPVGVMKGDELGVWVQTQLDLRDDWQRAVYGLAERKALSWSSGTASHLVERDPVKRDGKIIAHRILTWPLGLDASLTPTPAEPRNDVVALKSWGEESPTLDEVLGGKTATAVTLLPGGAESLPLAAHSEAVVSANAEYAARLESRLDARVKAGRVLSAANVTELEAVLSALDGLSGIRDRVTTLLEKARTKPADETTPHADEDRAALAKETLRLRTQVLRRESTLIGGITP